MTTATIRDRLIDDLLEGEQIGRTHVTDIIRSHIELDEDDLANLLNGSVEWFMDRQRSLREAVQPYVESFVDMDPHGQTLLAERLEKLYEEREADLHYELTDQKSREGAGEHYANPIGVPCGCTYDRRTKKFTEECAQHQGLEERIA